MSLVSVIIPTYNRADMLEEALESVFHQTYSDLEVVVVDDGSTDHTSSVLAKHRDQVKHLRQKHQGRSRARNAGIIASRGSYVAFLDDDDVWLPHKVERQVRALEESPDVSLVYGSACVGQGESRGLLFTDGPPANSALLEELMAFNFAGNPTVVMVRREILQRSGLFDPACEPCEDWDLWLRIAQCDGRFAHVREPMAEYRLHGANTVYDFDLMGGGRIAVLEKFFSAPGTPAHVRARRAHYVSRALIRVGMDRYNAAQPGRARESWIAAMGLDVSVVTPQLLLLMTKSLAGSRTLLWYRRIRDRIRDRTSANTNLGST